MNIDTKSKRVLTRLALSVGLVLIAGCGKPSVHASVAVPAGADLAAISAPVAGPNVTEALPTGFTSATVKVNGTTLRYVAGGQGPALILIHGFPEDWTAFSKVMPGLAATFRVVAMDLRGIGGSTPTEAGYDTATLAEDVHQLGQTLGLDRPYVVGHDIGGGVAYALARLHPGAVRGVMILDVPIVGVDPWDRIKIDPALWHFGFHQAPGLAEQLLAGREGIYIGQFLRDKVADPKSISDADIARYARAYALPGRMGAAMKMYRATDGEKFGREQRGLLEVPIALVGGGVPKKGFGPLLPAIAKGLEDAGARSVAVNVVGGSGHYVVDEKPEEVSALIARYAARPGR